MTDADKNALFRLFFISMFEELDGNTNSFVESLLYNFMVQHDLIDELKEWLHLN